MANEAQRVVKVGQVWADNDKRSGVDGRYVRVMHFEVRDHWRRLVVDPLQQAQPTHARCMTMREDHGPPYGYIDVGPPVSIRLDRFRPTSSGYRLVSDVA